MNMSTPVVYGGGAPGESAYELYVEDATANGIPVLSEEDWLASLAPTFYDSRANLKAAVDAGQTWPDGRITSDGSVFYVATTGATAIADLPGLLPFINVYAEHFHGGGTDYTAAFNAALAYSDTVFTLDREYAVTALTGYSFGKSIVGPGRVVPSAEFQTFQYGSNIPMGYKDQRTLPVVTRGGPIIGGQGPTEHGVLLKAQRTSSIDLIPTQDFNPIEVQYYANKVSGVVTSDGSGTVTYLKGFDGNLDRGIYVGDRFWVNRTEYTVTAKPTTTTLTLTPNPPIDANGTSAHVLYETSTSVVNISGTTVTVASGELFVAGDDTHIVIGGTRFPGTVDSTTQMTLVTPPGDQTGTSVLFRRLAGEDYVQILRMQSLRGQGTEETFSLATTPYENRIRTGRTADGIGEFNPLRIEGGAPADEPFPNNPDPVTWAYWDEEGNMATRRRTPEANMHLYRQFNVAQGADDTQKKMLRVDHIWNGTPGSRRCLDIEAHNDQTAAVIQGRSGATLNTASPIIMQKEGSYVVVGDIAGRPSDAGLYVNSPSGDNDIATVSGVYRVANNQVVGARRTGWTAATGTAARTAFDTEAATTAEVARRLKALIDDLIAHGLIG